MLCHDSIWKLGMLQLNSATKYKSSSVSVQSMQSCSFHWFGMRTGSICREKCSQWEENQWNIVCIASSNKRNPSYRQVMSCRVIHESDLDPSSNDCQQRIWKPWKHRDDTWLMPTSLAWLKNIMDSPSSSKFLVLKIWIHKSAPNKFYIPHETGKDSIIILLFGARLYIFQNFWGGKVRFCFMAIPGWGSNWDSR